MQTMSAPLPRTAVYLLVVLLVLSIISIALIATLPRVAPGVVTVTQYIPSPTVSVVTVTAPAAPGVTVTVTVERTITVTAPPTPVAPRYTFYYISHGGPGDPWWAPVIKAAELAGSLLGVKVVYLGPEKFSIKWLVDAIESAIAAKPDGIIVTITDYKAVEEPLRRAIAAGIPVIAVNVPDPRPPEERIPYLGYIGQEEYQAGYELAKYVIKWFKDKFGRLPKLAFVGIHEPGHVGLELRAKGIADAFKEAGAPYTPEKLDITVDPTKAYEIMSSYLAAYPDVEVIFTLGPLGAHPAIKLVTDKGLKGKVWVATVDLDPIILDGIMNDIVIAAISQQPFAQGFLPVVFMYLYVEYGIKPPEHIPTGPTVVDKALLGLIEKQIAKTGGA